MEKVTLPDTVPELFIITSYRGLTLTHTPVLTFHCSSPFQGSKSSTTKLVTSVLDVPYDQLKIQTPQLPTPKHFLQYFTIAFFSVL